MYSSTYKLTLCSGYCSNYLVNTSTIATDGRCNMLCSGNSSQICGGPYGLTLYQFTNGSTQSSSPSSTSTSSATTPWNVVSLSSNSSSNVPPTSNTSSSIASTSSPSSFIIPTASTPSITNSSPSPPTTIGTSTPSVSATATWAYAGCAADKASRVLTGSSTTSPTMTTSLCQSFCLSSAYPLAGLEYSSQCFCGSSLASNTSSTSCSMACAGNSSQICGGPYALSLYSYTGYIAPLQTTTIIGNYTYQGCWTDNVQGSGRSLKGYSFTNTTGMTEELCVGICQTKGYAWAG